MKQWFKKNKWKVLLPLLAAAVLAAAFWYGSSAPGARGWQPSEPDTAPATQENSEITEPSATAGRPSEKTEPAGENTDSTEGQPSGVPDDATEPPSSSEEEGNLSSHEPSEPSESQASTTDENVSLSCTVSITCASILDNMELCDPEKLPLVPADGVILASTAVTFSEGESVFDVLRRVCREYGIHMESTWTPLYNSAYIEGIANLYEFDVGSGSGWVYKVNGWFPNYGCSSYLLQDGDNVCWVYTCNYGKDIGGAVN